MNKYGILQITKLKIQCNQSQRLSGSQPKVAKPPWGCTVSVTKVYKKWMYSYKGKNQYYESETNLHFQKPA